MGKYTLHTGLMYTTYCVLKVNILHTTFYRVITKMPSKKIEGFTNMQFYIAEWTKII